MELFFKILAVILAGVAAFFLWKGNGDGAFISAVLGAVSFFLSVRFQVKGRLKEREEEKEREGEEEISEPIELTGGLPLNEQINNEQQTTDKAQI